MDQYRLRPLLIFTGEYSTEKDLNRIGVANTAELLKKAYFDRRYLGIPFKDGKVIENDNYVSSCNTISSFLQSINPANDVVLIHYCGHGFPNVKNESVVLAMSDTNSRNWTTCGLDVHVLIDMVKENSIKHYIIILDCCHSGYLCDMGDNSSCSSTTIDFGPDTESAVYIASTEDDDICNQICIDNNYYLPFSYYFAQYLLEFFENNQNTSCSLSINQLYEYVNQKLETIKQYPHKCNIQHKAKLGDYPLFKLQIADHLPANSPHVFHFSDYLNDFDFISLKVLLVKTAINYPIKYDDFGVPLGLWVLKGYLSTTGLNLEVDIYDERLELQKCGNDVAKREKVISSFGDIISEYDVVGISLCTCEVPPAMEKFEIAKKQNKVTFCGGIFTSSNEEYLLGTNLVDYVIPGVATTPLGNLLGKLCQEKKQGTLGSHTIQVDGVASKEYLPHFGGAWTTSQLPAMRKAMWIEIVQRYGKFLNNRMDVYTARGCDKNCAFCSVQRESQQQVIRKPDDCVIDEIIYLKEQGFTYFSFKDEDFLSKPKRMISILEAVKGEGIKFKLRARYDAMVSSKITLDQLSKLGVDEIQYGIESPDIHIRKAINKGYQDNSELISFIRNHNQYGITANCSFILGISGEDVEYYDALLEFIKKIYDENSRPKVYINFFTPHPFNSRFSNRGYALITKDLNYFTHKFPVCFADTQSGVRKVRSKMLRTYDEIVDYTDSSLYNPKTSVIPRELKQAFLNGTRIRDESLPKYELVRENEL